ncbi:MAG: hypothetical protein KAU83_06610 [Bacteroidales bacterium]|nr:hypothetical protein [Bacteroidales bacterium]
MLHKLTIICRLIILALVLFAGCDKEEDNLKDPTISFKTGEGYTYNSKSVPIGDSVKVGIVAESNGVNNLIYFEIKLNEATIDSYSIDKPKLDVDITITKGDAATEVWKFKVTDNGERSDSVSLTLTKSSSR